MRSVLMCLVLFGVSTAVADESALPKRRFDAASAKDAEQWQRDSRRLLFDLLKLSDMQKTRETKGQAITFAEKMEKTEPRGSYTWHELEINSTPTRRIKVVVTLPIAKGTATKVPGVVCIHGHGGNRFVVYDRSNIYHGFATELAERGYATISCDVGQHNVYEKGRSLMGERLWDVLRCADYLAARSEVDADRLGCAGLSLGGEMAMWLGAMDPRMKVTVSSGFLTTVANMRQSHCPCWDFPGLTENFDFSDIYSLTAPRALSCQIGRQERAPGGFPVSIAEPAMAEIQRTYSIFQAADRATLDVHPEGHVFIVPTALAFIDQHLKK